VSINLTLFFEVIAFLAFIYSFKRFLWKPILTELDARDKKIADGLAAAEQGKQDLTQAEQRSDEILREAKQHAQEIIVQADKRAAQLVDEAKANAQLEGGRLIAGAKAEIEQEMFRAREALRIQVAQLAVAGAENILKREVDPKVHADMLTTLQAQL
jgi:F-type H+-transporting ATPase subunit b